MMAVESNRVPSQSKTMRSKRRPATGAYHEPAANSTRPAQPRAAAFARAEKEYGVPPAVIAAFWGLESSFGAELGKLHTLPSLVSLAYDCRRSEMFQKETIAALKIIDRGDLTASEAMVPRVRIAGIDLHDDPVGGGFQCGVQEGDGQAPARVGVLAVAAVPDGHRHGRSGVDRDQRAGDLQGQFAAVPTPAGRARSSRRAPAACRRRRR